MTVPLSCLEIEPTSPGAPATVVWLHGLGADGHDFEPIVPMLGVPHARFLFPHAPRMPVTINYGMVMRAWYDIRSLDRIAERENEDDIRASAALIEDLLQKERARGVTPDRIVLAGFSQGGAMALHVGLRHAARLAGIIVLSGYVVLERSIDRETHPSNADTPILLCHGLDDPLVPIEAGRATHRRLTEMRRLVTWHEFPIAHEVSPAEIEIVATWLQNRLPRLSAD